MKEMWLIFTLATSPVSHEGHPVEANYCEQFTRDFWGAQAIAGTIYEYEWPDGQKAKINSVMCVNPETAQGPAS